MTEEKMREAAVKHCDYCEHVGAAFTFIDGETICKTCLINLPLDARDCRREIVALRNRIEELQACAARMVTLHAEQIRVAAVAAIREVTGCPDIKGKDGAYLVDALIVNLLEPSAQEPKK